MIKYELTFFLPHKLWALDRKMLRARLERELQLYFDDRSVKAVLSEEGRDYHGG